MFFTYALLIKPYEKIELIKNSNVVCFCIFIIPQQISKINIFKTKLLFHKFTKIDKTNKL